MEGKKKTQTQRLFHSDGNNVMKIDQKAKKKQEKLFHSYKETNANTLKQTRFSAGFSKHLLKPEDFNRLQGWEWGLEVLSTF